MITIYGDKISGNCLKVKYVADILGLNYSWHDIDVVKGEAKSESFLKINPSGQVPVVKFADGRVLSQSNAIMIHLASASRLIPGDIWQQAKMHEWLFWEQYSHETAIAVARFQVVFLGKTVSEIDTQLVQKGYSALNRMEQHLSESDWFVGNAFSLADIALYAYTQFAPDAGFEMESYTAIAAWINRVREKLAVK